MHVAGILLLLVQDPAGVCSRSPYPSRLAPAADLYCIDLVPAPDFPNVSGAVELRRVPTPFGAAVSRDGRHMWDLRITLSGLPRLRRNGGVYVAWVTTPTFDQFIRLGEARNGQTTAGRIALNSFLVIVSVERSLDVTTREGRIVMRGMSAANVMRPYDFTALPPRAPPPAESHSHGGKGWPMPPMHRAVPTMIPGLEALRPDVTPFRPGVGADTSRIPRARPRQIMTLADGDSIPLHAMLVRRSVAGRDFIAYGFNAQWPGPLIRVDRAATIVVKFMNRLDQPTAVHWHGIRLDNRFDGVPHVTQELVPPGGSFRYVIHLPDAGIYWYHPHHREDIQQDLGLYGSLLVRSADSAFFGPAHREVVLMLDDFLMADAEPLPHGAESPSHALMGRFGNVLLVNGEPSFHLSVSRGEVVRFYFTNAANTRPFNISIDGARLKLVGGDVGKLEREEWVESVVLAPAERWIVDAQFERPGLATILNRVQAIDHGRGTFFAETDTLGRVVVAESAATPVLDSAFQVLRINRDVIRDIDRYRSRFTGRIDKRLILTMFPDSLPFGLVQVMRLDTGFVNPVEWSGTMPMMDWLSTGRDVSWQLVDAEMGTSNMDINWTFQQGDVVRIRLGNDRHTLHPMSHPIHIHGQRFLVLAQNGVRSENLVWKDTFLLPVGWTADLLVEMSNPGRWMLHCHIAEHLETGMHTVFTVLPSPRRN
jgi:suppressor of ftsI